MQKLKIDTFYWEDLQFYVYKDRKAKTKPVTGEIIYLSMKVKKIKSAFLQFTLNEGGIYKSI